MSTPSTPPHSNDDALVPLGVVARPHGIRGELRVHAYNADSPMWGSLKAITLRSPDGQERPGSVLRSRKGPKTMLVQIEGCDTREAADALRGTQLCISRSELPDLDDEEYYLRDLVGLRVVTNTDAPKDLRVTELLEYPSVRCLRVEGGGLAYEVPLLPRYIAEVDTEAGELHVRELDELPEMKVQ